MEQRRSFSGGRDGRRPSFGGNRRSFGGPRRSFGGDRGSFGDRRSFSGPSVMHDAICNQCGKNCQVPFRPNGSKPVMCSACFQPSENRGAGSFGAPRSHASSHQASPNPEVLKQINAKLDKILKVLQELELDVEEEDEDADEEVEVNDHEDADEEASEDEAVVTKA